MAVSLFFINVIRFNLRRICFSFTAFLIFNETFAQEKKSPNFFGINPSITVEPYYKKGELDVNVLPFVWQKPLFLRMDLRLSSILNLGVRETGNVISHYGLEFAGVVFIKRKTEITECPSAWFVAPVVSLTQNQYEDKSNVGLWLEPGYAFLFENKFALSLGLQFGMTAFISHQEELSWGNHFGFKVIFGKWFP